LQKGKKIYSDNIQIYYLPSETLQISPVVSKKISKKAVIRNKIKRRIRHLGGLVFEKGKFAIVVKKNIAEYDFELLYQEFKKLTGKIN
jgi:ribonuclease P protein component